MLYARASQGELLPETKAEKCWLEADVHESTKDGYKYAYLARTMPAGRAPAGLLVATADMERCAGGHSEPEHVALVLIVDLWSVRPPVDLRSDCYVGLIR
jgi:hypothetical protein